MDTIQPIQPNQLSTSPFSYSLAGQDNIISLGGSTPNHNTTSTSGDYVTFLNANDQGQSVDLYLKVGLGNVLEFSNDGVNYFQVSGLALSGSKTVSIDLGSGNDSLHVDSSLVGALQSTGTQIDFNGGTGNNTLFGPNLDATWNITGQNSGNVDGINFSNVANLKAADNNYATFDFAPGGSLSGIADGGSGNLGTLKIQGGSYTSEQYVASGPHSGEIILGTQTGTQTIQYAGLSPIYDSSNTASRVFTSTALVSNQIVLGASATSGQMTISSNNGTFESITFLDPSNSLTINGGGGDDTVTVNSLDPNFKGSLDIEESNNSASSVTFAQNLSLNGGSLTVNAASITVNPNVTISTQDLDTNGNSIGNSGSVSLNATNTIDEDIVSSDTTTISIGSNSSILAQSTNTTYTSGNISLIATDTGDRVGIEPFGYSAKNVSITLNTGDDIKGANITITSTATDLTDLTTLPSYEQTLLKVATQVPSQLFNYLIPGSVMIRGAHTSVTLNSDNVISSGTVNITATTSVDSSVQAASTVKSLLSSISSYIPSFAGAVGIADGEANISITGSTNISSTGDTTIESKVTTTDNVTATVYANSGILNQPVVTNGINAQSSGAAAAVAYNNTVSNVLIDNNVTINSSGGNIMVTAAGKVSSSAKATTAIFVDGKVGLGGGVNLDLNSITATVNGKLTAAGQVNVGQAIDLSQVDSSNNTITIQNSGFQTGDVVQYNSSGNSIGGLVNGQDYYVISLDPNTIELAQGAGITLNNNGVNANAEQTLTPVENAEFDPTTDVNTSNNEIYIPNITNANQIFVTGQHVSYSDPTGDPIGGLGSGGDYYVILEPDGGISLALNPTDAANGVAIPFTSTGNGTDFLTYTDSIDTPVTFNPSGNNIQNNIITIPNHGLTTGELVQYNTDPNISSNQNVLTNNTFDPSTAVNLSNSEITLLNADSFDPNANVNLSNSEITINSHGFQTGEAVTYAANYLGQSGNAIGGLTDGATYYVIYVDNNTIQLADSYADAEAGKFIQFTSLGTAGDLQALQSISGSGLQTGDAVTYATNYMGANGQAIGGLTNGTTYYAIYVNDDTVKLADSYADAEAGKFIQFTSLGTGTLQSLQTTQSVTVGDTAIGGLEDGDDYYVTVLDANHILLSDTYADAINAAPIALDPTLATGNQTLTLVPDGETAPAKDGITISATLSGSDKVNISGKTGSNPKIKDLISNFGFLPLLQSIAKAGIGNTKDALKAIPSSDTTNPTWSFGGGVGINYVANNVNATVGSSAILKSSTNVDINANITDYVQLIVDSSTARDDSGNAVSISVGVGIYHNYVNATVSSDATIDASDNVSVKSKLDYPFLFDSSSNSLVSTSTITQSQASANIGNFVLNLLLDGKLGIPSLIFNSFVTSRNKGKVDDKTGNQAKGTGIAFSADVTDYDNESEATIGSGAKINQDPNYTTSIQSVDVAGETDMTLLNGAGVISLDLNIDGLLKTTYFPGNTKTGLKKTAQSADAFSFFGNKAQNGYGGAAVIVNLDNTTLAEVDSDAEIHTGTAGTGLTVDGVEDVLMINLAQSGGLADKIGISGSFSVVVQNNQTLAQLASGVQITGGPVSVSAQDATTHINLVGSVQLSQNLGIGVSAAVDTLTRTTQAIIGNDITGTNSTPGNNDTNIDSTSITLNADSTGVIGSLSLAGAASTTPTPLTDSAGNPIDANGNLINASGNKAVDPPAAAPVGDGQKAAEKTTSGVGIAGDASVNIVNNTTNAYINDDGIITANAGAIDISSTDNTWIVSAAGAAAIEAEEDPLTKASAGAGSFAVNYLTGETEAFIAGATISAERLSIISQQEDFVASLTAGVAVAASEADNGYSIAGSFSYNEIQNTTLAYVSGATVKLADGATIHAIDGSNIWSIAGAGAFGGAKGAGISLDANIIGTASQPTTTQAYITGSHFIVGEGTVDISATNNPVLSGDPSIIAIAGSVGYQTGNDSIGGAGMVAVNIIEDDVEAYISSSSLIKDASDPNILNVNITAEDDSWITSVGGSVEVGQSGGLGAAVSYNQVDTQMRAYIDNSQVTVDGSLNLNADSTASVTGGTLGVGVSTDGTGLALAGSSTINLIANTIDAHISDNSRVTTNGAIAINAKDNSLNVAVTGGVAVSTGESGKAVGAAVGYNLITNDIESYIDNSSVTSNDGSLQVTATDSALLISVAVGGAGAGSFAFGGSVSVNSIANDTDAHIADNSQVHAQGDINVAASEQSSLYSVSGGIAISTDSAAVGAAIAYNYMGGSFDPTNPNVTVQNQENNNNNPPGSTNKNQITAYIDNSNVVAGGNLSVTGGFNAPTSPLANQSLISSTNTSFDPSSATVNTNNNEITLNSTSGFTTGEAVVYNNNGGTSIGGLQNGGTYYVIVVDSTHIELASTSQNAGNGNAIQLTSVGSGTGHYFTTQTVDIGNDPIDLPVDFSSQITSVTVGGSGGDGFALGGSVSLSFIHNSVDVYVSDTSNSQQVKAGGSLNILSGDTSQINSGAGGIGISLSSGAIGAAISYDDISNVLSSHADNNTGSISAQQIQITSTSSATIYNVAFAGSGGEDFALGGAVTVNAVSNTADAHILNSANVLSTGSINIQGTDNSSSGSYAGALVFGADGPGIGASIAINDVSNTTNANISSSKVTSSSGNINLNVTSAEGVYSIAAGGAGADDFALGGSVTVNNIDNTEKANITNDSDVQAQGTVALQASDNSTVKSLAGEVAIGGDAAIGVAVATNNIGNQVIANIDSSTVTSATGDVNLTATTTDTIESLGIGGSVSGDVSLAGAATLNKISNTIQAAITGTSNASTVQANGNVKLTATDGSTINSLAGQVSLAGDGSIGAAVATNTISNNISADISNAQVTAFNGGVNLSATSTEGINSIAAGGAGAGDFAAGGAVTLNTITNTIKTDITSGSVISDGNGTVNLTAKDNSTIKSLAGQVSGGGDASVGASVATNTITNQTIANIDNSQVTSSSTVALSATSQDEIDSIAAGAAGAGDFALGGSVTVNNINNTEKAAITGGSNVQSQGVVGLQASDNSTIKSLAGQVAIGGDAAIGVAVSTNNIGNKVIANIDSSTVTSATSDVNLTATTTDTIESLGIGGSVSGDVSLAGAATLNKISNTIQAAITGTSNASTVQANGNVNLTATDGSTINSLAGQISLAGDGSIGAAVATNTISNNISADISNAQVTASNGGVNLSATSTEGINSIAAGGAGAGDFAAGGAVTLNTITNTIKTDITSGSVISDGNGTVNLTAKDNSTIKSLAGQVSGGGDASVGASVATNTITNQTIANIDNSQVTSSSTVALSATSQDEIDSIAAGAAGAGDFALGGSVTVNNINNTEKAAITGGSNVQSQGVVGLQASDNSTINSIAGQVAIGGDAAIGVAVSTNNIGNKVIANIDSSTVTSANSDVNLTATTTDTIESLGIGGSGSANVAIAGAATVNNIANTIEADITSTNNASNVQANGNVNLTATDASTIKSLAGEVSVSAGVSVGASVSTNNISNKILVGIDPSTVTAVTGDVNLTATSTDVIESLAVGGTVAVDPEDGGFAAGGAVTLNNISNTIHASITNGSTVQANGSVNLTAIDNSTIKSLAGQVSIGGGASVGASVATNEVADQAIANIDNSQVTAVSGNVNLNAASSGEIDSIAAGGSGAGLFAIGGSVTVNKLGSTIEADIANGSDVQATQGSVLLTANNNSTINSLAGQIAISGGAAIGAAIAVNNSSDTITAYISDSTVTSANQVNASATNTATIESASIGASVSGEVSLTGSVSVNNINNTIDAHIFNSTISVGSLDVSSADTSTINSLAGQISISFGAAAIGAAVAYNNISNTITAYAENSQITTANNALLNASSAATIETVAAGGSVSGGLSLAGSTAVNQMSNQISAYIQGGRLTAQGSVGILANSANTMTTNGGTFAAGLAGIGGTVVVDTINNSTRAYINQGIVDALGYQNIVIPTADGSGGTTTIYGLGVIATSQEGLTVKIGTGAIGGLGLAATIIVNSFTDTTQAFIQESAINAFTSSTNQQQSVYIKALNQSNINDEAGSVAVGLVGGVGATIDVTTIDNATTAFIGPGQSYVSVNANKDVVVEATTQRTLQSKVVAGSAGLGLGVSGAVYILNIGSASSPDDLQAASDTQSKVDQELAGINGMANNNIQTNQNAINNSFSASVPTQVGTTAYISGKVGASGDIIVTANETTNVGANSGDIVVGAAAIGGILGAGGAVAVVNVTNDVSAYVTANSILAGGNISIQANGTINGGNLASYAGTAGLVGLGAAVTELTSNNNTSAYIGAGTVINQAHNINVNADSSSTLGTDAEGASFGAIAAGAVISSASETGTTQAYLDSGVQIQNADNLTVTATVNDTVSATDQAAAGGLGAGSGTIPTATVSPTIKAYLGNNDNIQVTQNVQVSSDVAVGGSAYAKGISIGGITVGVSEATVNSTPNIDTHLGSGLTIQAANVSVTSNLGQPATVPGDTTFNPSTAVNNSNGTITFDSPDGLTTGQQVVYLNGGGSSIGGLTDNQAYSVIVVNSDTVELGSVFDASQVNTANSTITFSNGHDFQNGDKVIYEATSGNVIGGLVSGDTYYVKVINATTVQLTSTYADATTATDTVQVGGVSAVSNNAIDYSNNAFQNGDLVNYQLRTAQFSVYDSSNTPSSTIATDANGPEDILNLNTQLISNSIIHSYGFDTNHAGFANGDQVIYTCTSGTNSIGGLVSGQKYYVEVVDADDFQLSLTLNGPAVQITSAANGAAGEITAVGLDTVTPGASSDFTYISANSNSSINLANNGFSTGDVVQYQVVSGGTALSGLTSGQDYYVIEVDSNHLELATSLTNAENGTAITLGTSTSQQQLTLLTPTPLAANTNYYVVGETGNSFQLATTAGGSALTLITTGLTGTGSDFIFDRENVIALTSTGTGEQNLHFALDNSTATGTAQQLSPGTSVSIPTPTNYVFSAYSQASSGSLVGVNATQTTINATPTITTYVGNQASITTSGNFTVTSYSDVQLSGGTTSDTDGAIAVGASNIDTTLTNNNSVYIGNGATIQAQGDVSITSQSDHSVSISAYGSAGALIPVANATANATITDQTITTINDNASITATGDILVQSSGNTYANTEAKTDGGGLVPYAHSRSTLNIADDNETNIDAATLTGRNVTVQTVINQLDVQARTDAEGAGLIGLINAVTNLNLTGTDALVNIGSGALLKGDYINLNAQYQNFSAQSLSYASCDGLGGDTDSTANSTIPVTTKVHTDANSTLETTYLNVTSDFGSVYHNTYAHSKLAWSITINFGFFSITITMDFGGPSTSDNFNPSSNTDFNSQVTLLARQENPFLTVAQNGQITSSANVTTTNDGTNIVVNNILNNSVGSVTFNMPYSTSGTFTDHGVYTIADPAFDTVNIQNYSNENLIINNIQTINTGAIPTISYSNVNSSYNPPSQLTNLTLPNPLLTNPTVVTIDNFGDSNLILQGTINNPHDRTVLFSGGSILSQGTQEDIITRDLTMDAQTGSIGANGQQIAIQLDQGYSPVTASVLSSDTYLSVEAATSDYLNLTAKALDNNPLTVDVTTMTATSGDVNLNIGQSTNGNGNNISALYQFIDPLNLDLNQQIVAGGNITINAGTTTTNIDGKTNFLSSTGILSIATGGYIEIANQSAELNVNQAISSGDAVTLTGAGNITLLNNAVVQSAGDTDLTAVNNLLFSDGSSLTSGNNVNLSAGNTFQLNATATITASNNATIYDNYTNPSAGALFNLYGWVYAKAMSIYGGAGDTNTFNIFRLATNTNLYTDASDNIVNIGSSQTGFNGTKDIKNQINLYDGATNNSSDTLNVDDSGDTSSTVGVLTDTTLTGLGMGSGIYYSGFEVLNINLGQTNNNFTILNTSATTNINGNNANNTFQVGPSVDAQGNVLDQIVNGTDVPGTNLLGTSNVTNITTGSGTNTYTINRNTGVLNINSGSGTNNFVVNTPISNGKLLANAQVNLVGNVAGKNNLTVNGSTLTTIQNNVSSINVVNSRLITLVNFLNPVVNSGTTSTGSSSGLLNRTLSGTSNSGTGGGGSSTVSPLLNRRLH